MNVTVRLAGRASLVAIGALHLVPFYILLNLALKSPTAFRSLWLPPREIRMANFAEAWVNANLGRALLNNVIITAVSIGLVILIGAIASYPLARYRTRLNNAVYSLFIACMIVPNLTVLVPLYKLIVDLGGMNQYASIIVLHITFNLPMIVFLYTGFIGTLPRELDESAWIDGCGRIRLLLQIVFPLLKPVTATAFIVVGVSIWNDYNFSLFFLQENAMKTITVSLSSFFSQYSHYVERMAAGCLIASVPVIVLYLSLQNQFIKGLSSGAVKG
ncbi:carbohydrate ABC transporter permease [Cohnella cellulosilytica]